MVLRIENAKRALDFYCAVVGLAPVRAAEFEASRVGFPSVRINETTILDLMARDTAARVRAFIGSREAGKTELGKLTGLRARRGGKQR